MTKILIAAVALAGFVTSSAYAHQAPKASLFPNMQSAYVHLGAPHVWGKVVYADGRAVGQDPDGGIRFQIMRDYTTGGAVR